MSDSRQYTDLVAGSRLFRGIPCERLGPMLERLGARTCAYVRGEMVFAKNMPTREVAIVLEGELSLQQYDIDGRRALLQRRTAGSIIALPAVVLGTWYPYADVFAEEPSRLLLFRGDLVDACEDEFPAEIRALRKNSMVYISCQNRKMMQKISIMSMRGIRSKVSAYLMSIAEFEKTTSFDIPFTRQELADYLAVDRCALSKELKKMSDDGLISFDGAHFDISGLKAHQ